MADNWKEVGAGGEVWDYSNRENPMKPGTEFVGTYLSMEKEVGENNSNLYNFESEKGDFTQIWGSTLLDTRFKNIKEGELVKVVYLGREESQKRKGKTYHNFQVFHKPAPFTEVKDDEEIDIEDIRI